MKVVFLNLADRDDHGLAAKSVLSLKKKYPPRGLCKSLRFLGQNTVELVDLFGMFSVNDWNLAQLVHRLNADVEQLTEIRRLCRQANKVMLGTHGNMRDTEQGHAGMGFDAGYGPVGGYRDFANVIRAVFTAGRPYRLSLIMCYGARGENPGVPHAEAKPRPDVIRTSFAFKFYCEFCRELDVTMTARTGTVSFDEKTGRSVVQTEAAISAELELDAAQVPAGRLKREYDDMIGAATTEMERDELEKRMLAYQANPALSADHPTDKVLKEWAAYLRNAQALHTKKYETRGQYGKYVYTFNRTTGHVVVRDKYAKASIFDAEP